METLGVHVFTNWADMPADVRALSPLYDDVDYVVIVEPHANEGDVFRVLQGLRGEGLGCSAQLSVERFGLRVHVGTHA